MTKGNFSSYADATCSPHELIESMAIDAAMLAIRDQLPGISDGELDRLQDTAAFVAQTLLRIAQVPPTWAGFLERMQRDQLPALRWEVADLVYDRIPYADDIRGEREAACQTIRSLTMPEHQKAVGRALDDIGEADTKHLIASVDAAFALGWQMARDAAPLVFKVKERGHADGA